MGQLDQRMADLLLETEHWPEAERIAYVKAVMAKVYLQIQAEQHAEMVRIHEEKYGRHAPRV